MWFIGVEVEQETSVPPPKKNPGSAPDNGAAGYVGSSRDPGFDQNTEWNSGGVNGIRDMIATRELGLAEVWPQARDWNSDDKGPECGIPVKKERE